MPKIQIYTTALCPYCQRAKQLLQRKAAVYEEIRVDDDPTQLEQMQQRSKRRSVPQIFIGEYHVGGSDDLMQLEAAGKLDELLLAS